MLRRMPSNRVAAYFVALGLLSGCAVGVAESEDDLDYGELEDAGIGDGDADGGSGGRGGSGGAGGSGGSGGTGGTGGDGGSGGEGGDGGEGGEGGAGGEGGEGGSGGEGGGGEAISCDPINSCYAATGMGTVRGDKGSDSLYREGTTSQWFTVWVTEADDNILPEDMSVTAKLVSPPGTNFDLYLYRQNAACGSPSGQSNNFLTEDSVRLKWSDGDVVANGKDDSETIMVEVRWVSGTCAKNATWTLTVTGNT